MIKTETEINGVLLLDPLVHGDERGFFFEAWNRQRYAELGIDAEFVQDNHSRSVHGTLRGLHYQIPHAQGKLVRVIAGEVFDVAVDLRYDSATFGKWTAARLSSENRRMMWIPPGMAHGFLVLSAQAEFLYKCTDFYHPETEQILRWNDPDIDIKWPLNLIENREPLLSNKDGKGKGLREAKHF